jgi:multiple antibiotic resistance protein
MLQKIFHDFVTLFVVINPVGNVPLFIAIAGRESVERQRRIAIHAAMVAAVILILFIALGQLLLDALGIGLASFQVAGALVLLILALRMVLEEPRLAPPEADTAYGNVAVFPLAMPFIAGPAAIMAVILLTDNNVYSLGLQVETTVIMLLVVAITYACLASAEMVQRLLGVTGANVVSRVMGLILAAVAVQSLIGGLRNLGPW